MGTTHTLYVDGHYPPGPLTSISETPCHIICSQGHSTEDSVSDGGPEFAEVFVIVWVDCSIVIKQTKQNSVLNFPCYIMMYFPGWSHDCNLEHKVTWWQYLLLSIGKFNIIMRPKKKYGQQIAPC